MVNELYKKKRISNLIYPLYSQISSNVSTITSISTNSLQQFSKLRKLPTNHTRFTASVPRITSKPSATSRKISPEIYNPEYSYKSLCTRFVRKAAWRARKEKSLAGYSSRATRRGSVARVKSPINIGRALCWATCRSRRAIRSTFSASGRAGKSPWLQE